LTVGGATFTVNQSGAPCSSSIAPTTVNAIAAGGTGTVAVTSAAGCSWTAQSNNAWITVSGGATGTGNGSVTYTVAANPSTDPRTGTITIGGDTLTVTQAGAPCAPTISPTSTNAAATGVAGTITVTAPSGCDWNATSAATWITVTAGAAGTGNGTVTYVVAANSTSVARTGTVTVAGKTFTVNQAALTCSFAISPASLALRASGGTGSITVTTSAGCTWSASSGATWVTISNGTNRTGTGFVSFTAAANTSGSARTATLTVAGKSFVVFEPSPTCSFSVSPVLVTAAPSGGTGTINVTTGSTCAWTISSSASWVTVATTSGTGSGSVTYSFQSNTGTLSRSALLSVAGVQVTILQNPTTTTVQNPATAPATMAAPTNLRVIK
jgi:hypothetical protein